MNYRRVIKTMSFWLASGSRQHFMFFSYFHDLEFHKTYKALNLWLDMPQYEKLYDVFCRQISKRI